MLEAKKGVKTTEMLFLLRKFLLSISDAEEKEIRERAHGSVSPGPVDAAISFVSKTTG